MATKPKATTTHSKAATHAKHHSAAHAKAAAHKATHKRSTRPKR